MPGLAVGIDLGTTNSVVALSQGGRPRVLMGPDGSPLIPSVVSFHPSGQTLIGATARARRAVDPANTVYSVKRLMGRAFASEEVKRARSRFAFELREGPDTAVLVHTRNGDLSLPEISALILREIRRVAEGALGEAVDRAVVTVPANFNELQRTATKFAGQIADLDVIRILNEPTAAALAYGYGRGTRERIAVYDFGGGTFDVTLLELSGNVFEVLATAGDTFLGGDDIDLALAENLADALANAHRIDARQDRRAYEMLRFAAEQAKIDLSSTDVATIRIPEIGYAAGGRPLEFRTRIARADLERLAEPLVARTFEVCKEALRLAGLKPNDCQTVILVGGSSRIPAVRARALSFFGKEPLTTLPPEQVVGMGAAILAEALTGSRKPRTSNAPPPARTRTQTLRPQDGPSAVAPGAPEDPALQFGAPGRPMTAGTRPGVMGSNMPPAVSPGGSYPSQSAAPAPHPRTTTNPGIQPVQGKSPLRATTNPGFTAPVGPPPPRTSEMTWASTSAKPRLDQLDEPELPSVPSMPGFPAVTPPRAIDDEPTGSFDPNSASPANRAIAATLKDLGGPATAAAMEIEHNRPPSPARGAAVRSAAAPHARSFEDDERTQAIPSDRGLSVPGAPFPSPPFPSPPQGGSQVGPLPGNPPRIPVGARTAAMPAAMPPPPPPPPQAARGGFDATQMAPPSSPQGVNRTDFDATYVAPPAPALPPAAPPTSGPRLTESLLGFKAVQPQGPNAAPAPGSAPLPNSISFPPPPGTGPSQPISFPPPPGMAQRMPGAPPLLLDVTPHTLGIETVAGMCEVVIPRNATIPVEQTREFATAQANQDSVRIRIAQGESRRFGENQQLGELVLSEITKAPRGEVKIAVTFELDADGTLNVRACEVATGRETRTRVVLLTMPTEAQAASMAERQRSQA